MNTSAQDLRVLVTAGAAGIGRAIALAFKSAGARVYVCDIADEALATFAAEAPDIGSCRTDMASAKEVAAMVERAIAHLGGLDVLVNNAGIAGPTARVEDIAIDDWDRTIAVDLNSMFYCTRQAVPALKAAGGGSIVNLSSIAGRLGYPLRTPYAAAKWGVVGLTKSLAIELGPSNIRVNAILPGVIEGERIRKVVAARAEARQLNYDEALRQFVAPVSLGRMVGPDEVADMAVFLASHAGRSISGQAISVDGDHGYLA